MPRLSIALALVAVLVLLGALRALYWWSVAS
jgi:hypothetical protein